MGRSQKWTISEGGNDPLQLALFSKAELEQADKLLREWIHWQNNPEYVALNSDFPAALVELQNIMFKSRNVFRLMSLPVNWQITGHIAKLSGELFYFESTVNATGVREPTSGSGTVEIIFLYPSYIFAPVLVTDHLKVPLLAYVRGKNSGELDEALTYISTLSKSVKRDRDFSGWMEDTKLCIMSREEWEKIERDVENAAPSVYISSISPYFAPSRETEFATASATDGLLGILQDEELVRTAAIASTLLIFERPLEHFVDGLARSGKDIQCVHDLNERYRRVCGIDAVKMTDSHAFSLY